VIFIDEIDTVRLLPFTTDDFFVAMASSRNREFGQFTFCLLGVSTPLELIRDLRRAPFKTGRRIELSDFTEAAAAPLAEWLANDEARAKTLLGRILHWTSGHPYLTQRLCQAVAEADAAWDGTANSACTQIDSLCESLFLSVRARHQDPNLVFVREWILRSDADLTRLLELYQQVYRGESVEDDPSNDLIHQLRLSGVIKVAGGHLHVRNRIYQQVFDREWINANIPDAHLEEADGKRVTVKGGSSIGRAAGNDVPLVDNEVSRRHALIQAQSRYEFWLLDLGSRNGTYVNGRRITQPRLLRDKDVIEIGPFRMIFRQSRTAPQVIDEASQSGDTVPTTKPNPMH
jgi:hypothetical protein